MEPEIKSEKISISKGKKIIVQKDKKIGDKKGEKRGDKKGEGDEKGKELPPVPWNQMTPIDIASWNLYRELRKYDIIDKETRERWSNEIKELPQLRYMNMQILAAALVYIDLVSGKVSPETFKNKTMDIVLEPIMYDVTTNSEIERKTMIRKIKTSILRYVTLITTYRLSS